MSSAVVLISQSKYLGFGFTTLHYTALKLLCHYDLVLLTSSCDSYCQLQSRQILSQTHNFINFNLSSFLTDENSCKKIRNPGLYNYRTGKQHRRN